MSVPHCHLLLKRRDDLPALRATTTFEQLAERLCAWPRLYFEPDGSFMLMGKADLESWQLEGQIHDGRGAVDSIELKGNCPLATFDELLLALGWAPADFLTLQLPRALAISADEARSLLAAGLPKMPPLPAAASSAAASAPQKRRTNFESLEDRRPLALGPGGHDYQLLRPLDGITWNDAAAAAAVLTPPPDFAPGRLTTIDSAEEQAFLQATFGEQLGGQPAWFGLTDAALAGQWEWLDDSRGPWQDPRFFPEPTQTSYVNWSVDEPALPAIGLVWASRAVSVNTGSGEPYVQSSGEFGLFEGDLEVVNPFGPGGRARQRSGVESVGRILGGRADLSALPRGSVRSTYEATFDLAQPEAISLRGTLAGFVASNPFELGGMAGFEVRLSWLDAPDKPRVVFSDVQQIVSPGSQLLPLAATLDLEPGRYGLYVVGYAEGAPGAGGRTATASWDFAIHLGSPRAAAFVCEPAGWRSLPGDALADYYLVEFDPLSGPQELELSNSAVAEDLPRGGVIGAFQVYGGTAPYSFELLDSAGGRFDLFGGELIVGAALPFDFETQAEHTVRVRVTDALGRALEREVVLSVLDANEAPTGIFLDNLQIAENSAAGTIVGLLFAADPDWDDETKLTLADDAGGRFAIAGQYLRVTGPLDFEQAPRRLVRVRATDKGGLELEREFEISLGNLNEPPTIAALANYQVSPGAETPLAGVALDDPDIAGPDAEVRPLRFSVLVDHGAVAFGDLGGLDIVSGENGGAAISLEGPLAALRRALDTLVFRAPDDYHGVIELTLKANDLGNSGAGSSQTATRSSMLHLASALATGEDEYQVAAGGRLLAQTYAAAVRAADPWGWWRLDDSVGETAALDAAGNHVGLVSGATLGGPSAIEGEAGSSARFGGTDSRILIDALPNGAAGLTLEAWIKPADGASLQTIVSARDGDAGWAFGLLGQQLVFSSGADQLVAFASLVRVGDWSHAVVVVQPSGEAAFYLDGALVGEAAGAPLMGGASLALGGHPAESGQTWTGDLDEVAVYERVLSAEEIAHHFASAQTNRTVLANDGDGQRGLSAELVDAPQHGTVELLPDGSFSYRPEPGFAGVDSFRYRAIDGQIASAPTKVTITVLTVAGDADFDGDVDLADFAALKTHFGGQGGAAEGDFNGDGQVDLVDFAVLKANFGKKSGGAS